MMFKMIKQITHEGNNERTLCRSYSTVEMNLSEISCVLFLLAVLEMISSSKSLTGDHVCSRIEKSVLRKEEEIACAVMADNKIDLT
jgi:hypothetical protein